MTVVLPPRKMIIPCQCPTWIDLFDLREMMQKLCISYSNANFWRYMLSCSSVVDCYMTTRDQMMAITLNQNSHTIWLEGRNVWCAKWKPHDLIPCMWIWWWDTVFVGLMCSMNVHRNWSIVLAVYYDEMELYWKSSSVIGAWLTALMCSGFYSLSNVYVMCAWQVRTTQTLDGNSRYFTKPLPDNLVCSEEVLNNLMAATMMHTFSLTSFRGATPLQVVNQLRACCCNGHGEDNMWLHISIGLIARLANELR